MSVWSLLLRVLLSLMLAVNGVAAAAVSVQMADAVDAEAARAGDSATAVDMPCHARHAQAMPDDASPAAMAALAPATGKHASDCCKSGLCRCACTQGAHAVLLASVDSVRVAGHDSGARAPAVACPAPALPHPIRPPIG
jgi:hypothetical protein